MKGYKGLDKDLKCNGFQFEIGKSYKHNGEIELCRSGFHFCENPMDVLTYYPLIGSKFAEIDTNGKMKFEKDKDSKIVSDEISIKAEIDFKSFIGVMVKGIFEFVKKKTTNSATTGDYAHSATTGNYAHSATTGYSAHSATTGDCAHSATTGYYAHSATTGNSAHSATTGNSAHSATTGDSAHSATTGNYAHSATTGYCAHSATTGNYAHSATTGYSAHSATTGDYAHSATTGENTIACSLGKESKAKSSIGNWIVLSEYDDNWNILCVKSSKVDGKKIKADTWYILKNGKFTEVE